MTRGEAAANGYIVRDRKREGEDLKGSEKTSQIGTKQESKEESKLWPLSPFAKRTITSQGGRIKSSKEKAASKGRLRGSKKEQFEQEGEDP